MPDYDVVGIGNALVDVIAHADDGSSTSTSLVKGSMTLIEADRALCAVPALGVAVEMSGGSAANTMCGVASFGGPAAYIGKVRRRRPRRRCSATTSAPSACSSAAGALAAETPTGRCLIVVTPDAQRTMNTYLGVSSLLGADDIDEALVAAGQVSTWRATSTTAPEAKEAFRKAAARRPRAPGGKVSLTLSDSFCVDRHRDDFLALVRDEVDILFANEDELMALYEVDDVRRRGRGRARRLRRSP